MGFKGFIATLYSSSFHTFVSRKIAGGLYLGLVWLVTIGCGLAVLNGLSRLFAGYSGAVVEGLLTLIGAPIATLILVVVLRLVFESSIALIVIAENTTKD